MLPAGTGTAELCRRHGISEWTFYRWRSKYGGMQVGEAKRLKVLEDENARLKRLVAEQALDNQMLRDLLRRWRCRTTQAAPTDRPRTPTTREA